MEAHLTQPNPVYRTHAERAAATNLTANLAHDAYASAASPPGVEPRGDPRMWPQTPVARGGVEEEDEEDALGLLPDFVRQLCCANPRRLPPPQGELSYYPQRRNL